MHCIFRLDNCHGRIRPAATPFTVIFSILSKVHSIYIAAKCPGHPFSELSQSAPDFIISVSVLLDSPLKKAHIHLVYIF